MTLCVEIDEKNPLADLCQSGAKVDGGGGLAYSTLLHGDGYRSGQECSESNRSWARSPARDGTLSLAAVFVIPLIAAVVGAAFAVVVGRQYMRRRKPYQAIWALALAMFGVAAAFETVGQLTGWSDATYKGYYLFGGLLNVGWLGIGSLLLLVPMRAGRVAVIVMVLISLISVVAVLGAHTNPALLKAQVPARGAIDVPGALALITNLGGSLLLVGGAAYSAWKSARAGAPRNRVLGLAILAAGAFIVAGGHSYAQSKGVYIAQPLSEALGIVAMFAGFLVIEARRELVPSKTRTA